MSIVLMEFWKETTTTTFLTYSNAYLYNDKKNVVFDYIQTTIFDCVDLTNENLYILQTTLTNYSQKVTDNGFQFVDIFYFLKNN